MSSTIGDLKIECTEFGDAMARYYVRFETMKIILSLEQKSKMSEIVSFPIIPEGSETHQNNLAIRFVAG